jgi:hypothetical protein
MAEVKAGVTARGKGFEVGVDKAVIAAFGTQENTCHLDAVLNGNPSSYAIQHFASQRPILGNGMMLKP